MKVIIRVNPVIQGRCRVALFFKPDREPGRVDVAVGMEYLALENIVAAVAGSPVAVDWESSEGFVRVALDVVSAAMKGIKRLTIESFPRFFIKNQHVGF